MKMRRPDTAGCAQVELAATVYRSDDERRALSLADVGTPSARELLGQRRRRG